MTNEDGALAAELDFLEEFWEVTVVPSEQELHEENEAYQVQEAKSYGDC